MQGLNMRIKKDLSNMYSQVCKSHNTLARILECQIRHPSIREFKSGIDLLIEITHGIIETAMPIRG